MTDRDEWLEKHKGAYIQTVGMVWECGDDECGCTEAQIVAYYENKVVRARVPITEWAGEFHTEHEGGADEELAAYRRALREGDPQREASIIWQEGIDYGLT